MAARAWKISGVGSERKTQSPAGLPWRREAPHHVGREAGRQLDRTAVWWNPQGFARVLPDMLPAFSGFCGAIVARPVK